ncbi:basal body-orientation factor 1-like [Genypterus blacodes]|uniref:basal body-orientation factor 1-like n=1 Tax=Genypterus blacodes TaxID=154954 RepID=UPI003F75D089
MPKKKPVKVKKAKGGKAKKDGKQEAKSDKESDVEKVKAHAALWEAKLRVTDLSRTQYRETCYKLARANEDMSNERRRAERDALDMIRLLHQQDAEKEEKISSLLEQLRRQEAHAREQQKKLVEDYTLRISELEDKFKRRSSEFDSIEEEKRKIREFQKRKAQLEEELRNIKENMQIADKKHRQTLNAIEYRFFTEKARLESEAEQRVGLLSARAHTEAILQLDDASRCVFKENVRLNEALGYHTREGEDLQRESRSLAEENVSLALNKPLSGRRLWPAHEIRMKKNAAQMKAQSRELSEMKSKVARLEEALEVKVAELEREKGDTRHRALVRTQAGHAELERMRKVLSVYEREMARVRQLAENIVEQRTELELFFHDALFQVRREVAASRLQYREEALQAYHRRMREATAGKTKFPQIRTFRKSSHSTNCVYSDLEEAERWSHVQGDKVEVSDLSWEQKEKVLRLLFAKMNGQTARKASQPLALSASCERKKHTESDAARSTDKSSPATFITQAPPCIQPSNPNSLPDIHTT